MGAGLWDWKGFKLGVLQFRVGAGLVEFIGHTEADGAEHSPKPISVGLTEAEELKKYITIREEVYEKAKDFGSKIISFETAIRRPYFHMQPLNSVELENWTSCLDFIEREDDLTMYFQ
ncbi:hypothetical protein DVH24_039964 [Malus domestica]|uniref:Uncharacterized protein n=1 Tax=Malus domestica TaxID=3750 RepID=A0A498IA45_MALDO|nr:hypothetical protein DVH24_039964 [Malus domestica]